MKYLIWAYVSAVVLNLYNIVFLGQWAGMPLSILAGYWLARILRHEMVREERAAVAWAEWRQNQITKDL